MTTATKPTAITPWWAILGIGVALLLAGTSFRPAVIAILAVAVVYQSMKIIGK